MNERLNNASDRAVGVGLLFVASLYLAMAAVAVGIAVFGTVGLATTIPLSLVAVALLFGVALTAMAGAQTIRDAALSDN